MIYFCYRVAPQKELIAVDLLRRRGYEAYCPIEKRFRRRSTARTKEREKAYPMMVGYIFISVPEDRWPEPLHRFDVIQSVVACAGGVACFTEDAIAELRRLESVNVAHRVNSRKSFASGELVYVVRGGMRDMKTPVRIAKIKGKKAELIVTFLGAPRQVEVPLEALEAA